MRKPAPGPWSRYGRTPPPGPFQISALYNSTDLTTIWYGSGAVPGTAPPIVPPTARFRIRNIGPSNGHEARFFFRIVWYAAPSADHVSEDGRQSSEYVCISVAGVARVCAAVGLSVPECRDPEMTLAFGFTAKLSMMSISPQSGQPTSSRSAPSIQIAGHEPGRPAGMDAVTSRCPYRNSSLPFVHTLPDRNCDGPFHAGYVPLSRLAVITSPAGLHATDSRV